MKRKNVFVSLSIAVLGLLLVSCESETFSNEKEIEQTLQTNVSTSEENENVVLFENTEELIEIYDALSEGDILLIRGINSKVSIINPSSINKIKLTDWFLWFHISKKVSLEENDKQ